MPIVVGIHTIAKADQWGFKTTLAATLLAGGLGGLLFGHVEQAVYARWLRRQPHHGHGTVRAAPGTSSGQHSHS